MEKDTNKELSALEKARLLKSQKEEEKKQREAEQQEVEKNKKQDLYNQLQEIDSEIDSLKNQKKSLENEIGSARNDRKENIGNQRKAVRELKSSEETTELLNENGMKEEIFGSDSEKLEEIKNQESNKKEELEKLEEEIAKTQEKRQEVFKQTPEGQEEERVKVLAQVEAKIKETKAPHDMIGESAFSAVKAEAFKRLNEEFGEDVVREYYLQSQMKDIENKYKAKENKYNEVEDFIENHSNQELYEEVKEKLSELENAQKDLSRFCSDNKENSRFAEKVAKTSLENTYKISKVLGNNADSSLELDKLTQAIEQQINAVQYNRSTLEKIITADKNGDQEEVINLENQFQDYQGRLDPAYVSENLAKEIWGVDEESFVSIEEGGRFENNIYNKKIPKLLEEMKLTNYSAENQEHFLKNFEAKKEEDFLGSKNREIELLHLKYDSAMNNVEGRSFVEGEGYKGPAQVLSDKSSSLERQHEYAENALRTIQDIKIKLSENLEKKVVYKDSSDFFEYQGAKEEAAEGVANMKKELVEYRAKISELQKQYNEKKSLLQKRETYDKNREKIKEQITTLEESINSGEQKIKEWQGGEFTYPQVHEFWAALKGSSYSLDNLKKEFTQNYTFTTLGDALEKMQEFAKTKQEEKLSEEERKILDKDIEIKSRIKELKTQMAEDGN